MNKQDLRRLDICRMDVYVDGSYMSHMETIGRAAVYVCYLSDGDERILMSANLFSNYEMDLYRGVIKSRQVCGELLAALDAICIVNTIDRNIDLHIYYDYLGIEKWATGEWKTKKHYTRKYVEEINSLNLPNLKFHKVPAHSGVFYNELADFLSRLCCKKLYKDEFAYRLMNKLRSINMCLTGDSYEIKYTRWGKPWYATLIEVAFSEELMTRELI